MIDIGRQRESNRRYSVERRRIRKAEGVCLNGGPRSIIQHGPPVAGGKCARCVVVHRGSR